MRTHCLSISSQGLCWGKWAQGQRAGEQVLPAGRSASWPLEQGQGREFSLSPTSRPSAGHTGPWRPPRTGDMNEGARRETVLNVNACRESHELCMQFAPGPRLSERMFYGLFII